MPRKRIEIRIVVQQREAVMNAESPDDDVDGFANGHSFLSEKAIVFRTFYG